MFIGIDKLLFISTFVYELGVTLTKGLSENSIRLEVKLSI